MEEQATPQAPKVGRVSRGWQLTKSSWRVLVLDKELAGLPFMSFVFTVLAMVPFVAVLIIGSGMSKSGSNSESDIAGWLLITVTLLFYFVLTFIANFFGGAVIYGATERFRGGDPTVKSSIAGARRKIGPLAGFSLMMASVGLLLQILEEKLPFAGAIATWLFDAAWNIANIFAVPVIVLTEENVGPITATKRSVGVIRKVWGESIVASLGVGVIGLFGFMIYSAFFGGIIFATASATQSLAVLIPLGVTAGLGLCVLVLVFSLLSSIVKAALYFYATTGKTPSGFDGNLLKQSIRPKKTSRAGI